MATMQNGFEVLRLGGLRGDTQPSPFSVVEQTQDAHTTAFQGWGVAVQSNDAPV
jgi:hypothetical protein